MYDLIIIGSGPAGLGAAIYGCLLYTSDAADEEDSVDLGGRRILQKKKKTTRQTPGPSALYINDKSSE